MVGYEYKECGNMRYFGNPIVVTDYLFCNVLYYIIKIFPLIYIYEHNWSNYIKTSFIVYVKAFIGTTNRYQSFHWHNTSQPSII